MFEGLAQEPTPGATGISTAGQTAGNTILALFDTALIEINEWPPGSSNPLTGFAIVGKYTFMGDMNFDGQVTGDDYTVIDANLNTTPPIGAGWLSGDANFDTSITGDDYTVVDANLFLDAGGPL